ncbi:helix-turn-helix transcriptional regulator [Marinobacter nauticus]|uniref:helix-turn-helix transcriptional regulator n=1 Tax=Marinobacter nauticus TaxID=2743 RepID=UPI001F1677B8|nr:helix-turn-helix domain-containing protein [Marinobacter nauticus]
MRNTTHVETTTLPPESTVTMPRLWDQKTLAVYLGKSTAWCERARWAGEGPRFIKLGRHVRYRAEDVLDWIDSHASASKMEGAA